MKMYNSFKVLIIFSVKAIMASSPNYRAFSPHEQYDYEYGYINLKAYPEKKLNMKPFNITTTSTREDCAYNCFTSTERQCQSINIKEIHPDEEYECQLMDFDKHKCYPHFIDDSEYTYYDIDTKCSEPMACPSKNHWCIPDHVTGSHSCMCKHDYEGPNCEIKRENTFSFKVNSNGASHSDKQPNIEKAIPNPSLHFSLSFWYYLDQSSQMTGRLLFNFGFPPSLCNIVRIRLQSDSVIELGTEKSQKIGSLPVREWVNIAFVVNLENRSIRLYRNGIIIKMMENLFDEIDDFTNKAQNIKDAWIILGNGVKIGGCNKADRTFIYPAKYKEFYAWNRLLDHNDFPLIYNKTFIPHNSFITWNDFKDDDERDTWYADLHENVEV